MDEATKTTQCHTSVLDLPKEILIDILSCHDSPFPVHDPSEYSGPQSAKAKSRLEFVGNNRLVCRTFNRLISPLLCPVVSVSLCSRSIDRLEGLSRNPLIAQGIRGIKISLLFRPHGIASDFRRYYAYTISALGRLEQECDYYTEFQHYDEDDASQDAATWRSHSEAQAFFNSMRYACNELLKERTTNPKAYELTHLVGLAGEEVGGFNSNEWVEGVDKAKTDLRTCFDKYTAAHADQVRIVSDGSFIGSVVTALSRCGSSPFIWFDEEELKGDQDVITIARNKDALFHRLTRGHKWLDVESDLYKDGDDTDLFFPASILTELPIACQSAKIQLKGISVNCFPLLKGYHCLVPKANETDDEAASDHWTRFATACKDLEVFAFGKRGMDCSPLCPERQSASDLAIIDRFIGAAISGQQLQRLHVSLTPFIVRCRNLGERVERNYSYPASSILAAIRSTRLQSIVFINIEISEQALLSLIKSASARYLAYLFLSSVTLSDGRYALAMGLLHDIVSLRRSIHAPVPKISFNTLQGAEFGEPTTFDDDNNCWMFGSAEERKGYWDRLEKHMHPERLKQVERWISKGEANTVNPLIDIEGK